MPLTITRPEAESFTIPAGWTRISSPRGNDIIVIQRATRHQYITLESFSSHPGYFLVHSHGTNICQGPTAKALAVAEAIAECEGGWR